METGLYAFCDNCGTTIGKIFSYEGELREYIIKNQHCPNSKCNTKFQIGYDGTIWNLKIEIIPSKEEYILKLLKEVSQITTQKIFCYADLGPKIKLHRYPDKRIEFGYYRSTDRATPAYYMKIFPKGKWDIENMYCFTDIASLLQIAQESLKGYYLLKYERTVEL